MIPRITTSDLMAALGDQLVMIKVGDTIQNALFDVTWVNPATNRRTVLIDNVTQAQADSIMARFNDKKAPMFYLPQLKVEPA